MVSSEGVVDILLVEDNPSDVKLTLHALKKVNVGNSIHVARDGAEALEYLLGAEGDATERRVVPKVVFLDIKLPKVDGLEVLRRIRADPRTADLPVVLVTSSQEDRDIAAGYRYRANSYVVKPIDFQQFAAAVSTAGMYWVLLNTPPLRVASEVRAEEPAPSPSSGAAADSINGQPVQAGATTRSVDDHAL